VTPAKPCMADFRGICQRCAAPFRRYRPWQRFCSRTCQQAAHDRLKSAAPPPIRVPSRQERIAEAAEALRGLEA
jgi:predicted amidophosphoribosyltransferase